jgi:SAM-dependent methyltransferase
MSHVPDLVARITRENKLHGAFFARALGALGGAELSDLDGYLAHCLGEGASLDELAADYNLVVSDTLREQLHFQRHGRYRFSRYDEVASSVYLEPRYMTSYMRGLALTAFFWPNHAALRRFFDRTLETHGGGRYLEVGPGHGVYFLAALRSGRFVACEGVDISPSSVALTERLLRARGFADFRLQVGDFLAFEPEQPADLLVMGEVLEHVERPDRFLAAAARATAAGGTVYLTTCANSPAFDHIYLFRSVSEIEELCAAVGLRVEDRLVLPYEGTTLEESARRQLAVNVALVLRHA